MSRVPIDNTFLQRLIAEIDRSLRVADLALVAGELGRDLDNIAPEGTKRLRVQTMVSNAYSAGWLIELTEYFIAEAHRFGDSLGDVCRQFNAEWARKKASIIAQAPDDPKTALVLSNGAPFVDRDDTRPLIDRLVHDQLLRVLVVRGDTATGKSHLAMFVAHLLDGEQHTSFATVDLSRMAIDSIGPHDLMDKLIRVMGLDGSALPSDHTAQDPRIAEKLCDWLIGQSQRFKLERWLLVFDGLNRPNVGPGALELVDRLSIAAARSELRNVKLLLLAHGAALPSFIVNDVEDHSLLPLGVADLRKYVAKLAETLGRSLEAQGIDELTQYVISSIVPPFGHDSLLGIRQRLRELPKLLGA